MKTAKGSPKPVATGKKGNVGGIMTPGRHGNHTAAVMAGVKNLVAAGPGTKKTPKLTHFGPDDKNAMIDAGNVKRASGTMKAASGSPKMIMGSGHKGIHLGVRPEGPISRDSKGVVKP